MNNTNGLGFTQFLVKLGFAPAKNEVERFVYSLEINQCQKAEIEFVYAPDDGAFSTETYENHARLWNSSSANALIVISENQTIVINPKIKPKASDPLCGKVDSFEEGVNASVNAKLFQYLSREKVNTGYFFEFVREKTKKNKEQEVDKDLLLNLIALRQDLVERNAAEAVADLLILRCLFLKYLEDRGIYPTAYLSRILSSEQPKKLTQAFGAVSKINGDIFKSEPLSETDFSGTQMQYLHRFFNSDYRSGQGTLFPYQFQYIPIQLISHVYEAFLNDSKKHGKGIYYTPQFIVRFMLEETLSPVLAQNLDATVMDPSCGSGAFLVESFRKIVYAKRLKNNFEAKKAILVNQIFGIDLDSNALRIAVFSLYLALLEDLDPDFIRKQIEDNAPILPSLIGRNLLHGNTLTNDQLFADRCFNCIVGNPPWGSVPDDDDPEHILEREMIGGKGKVGINLEYQNVSNFQRSQAFICRMGKWLDDDSVAGLIVNNSNFLNEHAESFRQSFLERYALFAFYELSHLDSILFKKKTIGIVRGKKIELGASEPAAFLVFSKNRALNKLTRYVAPRLTNLSKHLNLIHFTQRDVRILPQEVLHENDLAWKILVNGDWDDLELIRRKMNECFANVDVKCKVGFEAKLDMETIGEPNYRLMIKSKDFDAYLLKEPLTSFNWNQTLRRRPDPTIFEGQRILVAVRPKPEDQYRLRCVRIDGNQVFTVEAFGIFIKNGNEEINNLAPFLGILNSSFIGYFSYLIATQWGKGDLKRPKLRTKEIEAIPFPPLDEKKHLVSQLTQAVLSIERLKKDPFGGETETLQRQIDELVFDLYGLLDFEKETVREFYDIQVHRKGALVNERDLEGYVQKFKSVFELMLSDDLTLCCEYKISRQLGAFICCKIVEKKSSFPVIKRSSIEDEVVFHAVKQAQLGDAFDSNRLNELPTRVYTSDCFFLIKSHFYKDWTIRQAIEDANEEIKIMIKETQVNV